MFRKHFKDRLIDAKVGYTGGNVEVRLAFLPLNGSRWRKLTNVECSSQSPNYRQVCSGATNHAEALKILFDPSKVSYAELVEFHFRMHDPSECFGGVTFRARP